MLSFNCSLAVVPRSSCVSTTSHGMLFISTSIATNSFSPVWSVSCWNTQLSAGFCVSKGYKKVIKNGKVIKNVFEKNNKILYTTRFSHAMINSPAETLK